MGLLVGIDEAGYGPHLGPLVVAAAAIDFPGDRLPDPDLWDALAPNVCKRPARRQPHVLVCDSKLAYAGGGDLAALERTVLGFLAVGGVRPPTLADLQSATAPHPPAAGDGAVSNGAAASEPWHRPESVALPASTAAAEIEAAADCLRHALASIGAVPAGLWVNVASAARLNHLMDGDRNKAGALFYLASDLLAAAQARCPDRPIHVTMDRHGGRRYYGELLSGAFPMTPVETVSEAPEKSRYRLLRGPAATVDLTVCERCEDWSLVTALASMAAKYVRELHMAQLNDYFRSRVPGLRPTAGYGLDAWRFLDDVAAARVSAGVPDTAILRNR